MKILMANKFLYPRAGAETYMLALSEELMAMGHEVKFFGMAHNENYYKDESSCVRLIDFSKSNSLKEMLGNISRVAINSLLGTNQKVLDKIVAGFKPDIIHAHNIYNQISPRVFSNAIKQCPVIMTLHDFKPICPSYNCFVHSAPCTRCLGAKFYHCLYNKCVQGNLSRSLLASASSYYHMLMKTYQNCYSGYIAPSLFLKDLMVKNGADEARIQVLKNFANEAGAFTPPGNSIFYGGRFCEEKGVKTLLDAYSMLPDNTIPLRIAGSGPDEHALRDYAKQKKLNVTWLGKISPERIMEELDNCLLTVTPSVWYENCSISILESLGHGRICIVSDSGGNSELIEDEKNGWVFKAGNSHILYERLKQALSLSNKDVLAMSKYAYTNSHEKFNKSKHVGNLLNLYNELIIKYSK